MELLLILMYVWISDVIFKLFKIPVNKYGSWPPPYSAAFSASACC